MSSRQATMLIALIAIVVIIAVVAIWVPGKPMEKLALASGYGLLVLVFVFGIAILFDIIYGNVDLSSLLSEVGGGASMSRFQFLIFTFVIALSLFLIVASSGQFPKVPPEVLTLLGISASTYAVSKGIQMGAEAQNPNLRSKTPPPTPAPPAPGGPDAGTPTP